MRLLRLVLKLIILMSFLAILASKERADAGGNSSERLSLSPDRTPESASVRAVARLIDANQLDAAKRALSKEVTANGVSYQTHFLEARILFGEKRFEDSLKALEKSFALERRDAKVYLLAGLNWVVLNRLDLARPFLEEGVRLAPDDETMRYHLGRYYYTAQQFASAEREFREVVRLQPDGVKGFDNLGLALEAQGKAEQAIGAYRKAIELAERQKLKTEWPYLNLGKFLEAKGRHEECLSLARQAAEMNPRSAEAFYVQAKALQKLGKEADALSALRRSIENDPKFSESHYLLGRIYLKQGRKSDGQKELEIFQSLKEQERKKPGGMSTK
jgi:tetratricopeptide (TPR) repeat protein